MRNHTTFIRINENPHFLIGRMGFSTIILLALISCWSLQGATGIMDQKSKAVYQKISAKIAKLERERIAKTARIKSAYVPAAAEIVRKKLNLKIDRAIDRYKLKGNKYFRRRALPEPWTLKSFPPPSTTNPSSITIEKTTQSPVPPSSIRTKHRSDRMGGKNELLYQTPPTLPFDDNAFAVTTTTKSSSGFGLALMISALIGGFFFFLAVFLISYLAFFRKSSKTTKVLMGCGFLLISGIFCVSLIVLSIFWMSSSQSSTEKNVNSRKTANQPATPAPVNSTIVSSSASCDGGRVSNDVPINRPAAKNPQPPPDPLVFQAETAVKREDLKKLKAAIIAARRGVEQHPDSVDALMRLGKTLVVINNNEEVNLIVDDVFSKVLRLDPGNIAAKRYLADARYRSGLYNSALIILEPLLEEGVLSDPKTLGLVNLCFIRDEQYETGLDFFKRMADKHPTNPYIVLNRAILARHAGDLTLARSELNNVIARQDIPNDLRNTAEKLLTICQGGN